MKITLRSHPSYNIYSTNQLSKIFRKNYEQYKYIRNQQGGESGNDISQDMKAIKEQLALVSLSLYKKSSSIDSFEQILYDQLIHVDKEISSYLLKENFGWENTPFEALYGTIEGLKIAQEITRIIAPNSIGIILSGSINRGPFFAVQGQTPKHIRHEFGDHTYNILKKDTGKISDVDLMVLVRSLDHLKQIIIDCIDYGFLKNNELERFDLFQQLYQQKKVNIFSCNSFYQDVETNIIFVFPQELRMALLVHQGKQLHTVKDLRPTTPGSYVKYGGYPLFQVDKSGNIGQTLFANRWETVGNAGYINTVPCTTYQKHTKTITIGLLSQYTSQDPIIIHDTNNITKNILHFEKETIGKYGVNSSFIMPYLRRKRYPSYNHRLII